MRSRHRPPPLLLLALYCALAFSAGDFTAVSLCLPDERSSLLQLRQGFSFPNSSKLASWRPEADCCDWPGVSCELGRVTGLDLSNSSVSGNLTSGSALFNLTSLSTLNLAYNLFVGSTIPEFGFERLTNLTHLNLSNSGFVGQIPNAISRLTNLVSLDLSTFYVDVAALPLELRSPNLRTLIGNLTNLLELNLDGVNISASGQEWCGAVADSTPAIQVLSLSGCSLAGPIDSSLSRLRNLSTIRLEQNRLNSAVPDFFANFSALSVLQLGDCRLQGAFPQNIFRIRKLKVVDVSANPALSGSLPEFPEDGSLQSLALSETNFTGSLPVSIGNLKSLSKLDLSKCKFYGEIPSSVRNLTQLVHLDLSLNSFSGAIPSVLPPRISELVLSQNNLTGPISPSLGNGSLRNLTKLDLHNNSISGSIPVSLFSLPSLQVLQLNLNNLSGQLVEFPSGSSMLNTIDLSNNKLEGEIPRSVFQLSGLKILTLSSNKFSGTVELDWLQQLRNLTSLDLSYNNLWMRDGIGNSSLSYPNITTLKLVSCNLTTLPGFLLYQDSMSSLDLSNNKIGGDIPKWIWSIGNGNLNYLNLSYNLFTHVEEPWQNISTITTLLNLDIHSNLLQGPIPLPPSNTIVLDYSNNNFSSSIPPTFALYLNFTLFFSLANNSLTGEIPSSICKVGFLQVLDFSHNDLSGPIPPCLLNGSNDLRVLNLRGNQLQGTIPQDISQECKLRTINLNGNRLEGKVPRSLTNCSILELLDLGNNGFKDTFPYWLGNISTLRVLVLRSNGFYGPFEPPSVSGLPSHPFPVLQIIDLSSNNFNGSLPAGCFNNFKAMMATPPLDHSTVEFQYLQFSSQSYYQDTVTITSKGLDLTLVKILTIFTSIDFSCNQFEGDIPENIGELKSLYILNFSRNVLTGHIPPQIGNLIQLESLDLSLNHLSGEIPADLSRLHFLSFLNLSYNNLAGRIPSGSQLQTLSNASFQGNEDLCGSPLSKQCSSASDNTPTDSPLSDTDVNWEFVFAGVGYGGGVAMMIGLLTFWEAGKRRLDERLERLVWAIVPSSFWRLCDGCGDGRVGAEEMEGDSMEEVRPGRKFCVFCTKPEFFQGRMVIHHLDCQCDLGE